ncbi:MAG: polysaccharide biosynthesis protein [Clostridia bacterium]|nr:polysaccharide biosynthesis protein [Clostridia bacterium]
MTAIERDKREKALRFSSGTVALAVSGLLVKFLGMVYKIPLTNILGDEGMGYFNAAYTVYTLFFVLSTSGLPVALSLLVSESVAKGDEKNAGKLYKSAARLFLMVGFFGMLLMALPARRFARLLGTPSAAAGILAVSPTLLFMTYAGALRGYFQGRRRMAPIALSQILEAGGKFLFGLLFALMALTYNSRSVVAAYAIFGLTVASFFATLSLYLCKRHFDRDEGRLALCCGTVLPEERKGMLKKIAKLAFPITVSASVMTLASSLDLFLVIRTLRKIGYSAAEANAAFGNYTALAVPLFNMPTVLILPIAYSVAPFVKGALTRKDTLSAGQAAARALSLSALLALPASFGLSLLSKPILSLLFSSADSVAMATPLLSVLALSVFPLALLTVTNSLLQAYGKLWFPIFAILAGIVTKCAVSHFGMLRYGMIATPVGTFLCYTVVAALNLGSRALAVKGFSLGKLLIKPFAASVPMAVASLLSYRALSSVLPYQAFATLFAIFVGVLVFVITVSLLKAVTLEDALSLGLSEGVARRLQKLHILS